MLNFASGSTSLGNGTAGLGDTSDQPTVEHWRQWVQQKWLLHLGFYAIVYCRLQRVMIFSLIDSFILKNVF